MRHQLTFVLPSLFNLHFSPTLRDTLFKADYSHCSDWQLNDSQLFIFLLFMGSLLLLLMSFLKFVPSEWLLVEMLLLMKTFCFFFLLFMGSLLLLLMSFLLLMKTFCFFFLLFMGSLFLLTMSFLRFIPSEWWLVDRLLLLSTFSFVLRPLKFFLIHFRYDNLIKDCLHLYTNATDTQLIYCLNLTTLTIIALDFQKNVYLNKFFLKNYKDLINNKQLIILSQPYKNMSQVVAEKPKTKQIAKTRKSSPKQVRLWVRAKFLGFRRSKVQQNVHQAILRLEGVNDRVSAQYYFGKRVAFIYKTKSGQKDKRFRTIWGRISTSHGNTGAVLARFSTNLPPRAIGSTLRVMLFPQRN